MNICRTDAGYMQNHGPEWDTAPDPYQEGDSGNTGYTGGRVVCYVKIMESMFYMSRFGSIVGNGKEKGNRRKVKLMLIPCKTPLLAFENHHKDLI